MIRWESSPGGARSVAKSRPSSRPTLGFNQGMHAAIVQPEANGAGLSCQGALDSAGGPTEAGRPIPLPARPLPSIRRAGSLARFPARQAWPRINRSAFRSTPTLPLHARTAGTATLLLASGLQGLPPAGQTTTNSGARSGPATGHSATSIPHSRRGPMFRQHRPWRSGLRSIAHAWRLRTGGLPWPRKASRLQPHDKVQRSRRPRGETPRFPRPPLVIGCTLR